MNKDIIVVGAGPAGISASIYIKRAGFNPILIEKNMPGGKLSLTHKINNYPGFSSISGSDLATSFMNQLNDNQIDIQFDDIVDIENEEGTFKVKGRYNTYSANAVIIASGTLDKKMGIPGEKEFYAKGVSNCAVCDGQFFKGNPMAIVGGNSKALEEALYLSSITDTVYVINKRSSLDAEQILVDKVMSDEHIKVMNDTIPLEIKGEDKVSSLDVESLITKEKKNLPLKAVFAYIGADSNSNFVPYKEIFDEKGFIKVDSLMKTSVPGIFACGDCIQKGLRQIVTACSDGAIAAISATNYLRK